MEAQYDVLRKNGHTPSPRRSTRRSRNSRRVPDPSRRLRTAWTGCTANCSATAQRGALDWKPKFKKATLPVFKDLYKSVKNGTETALTLKANSDPDYQKKLDVELKAIRDSEMWKAGAAVRALRPENRRVAAAKPAKKAAAKKAVAKKAK